MRRRVTSSRPEPDVDGPALHIRLPDGRIVALTKEAYMLALLGLIDFEGCWPALELATEFVVDGPAKRQLIRDRLLPVADGLAVLLERGVDPFELLAARYWFRHQPCKSGLEEALRPDDGQEKREDV